MGITTLLRFALLCIDLLAWPAIALGYPLFASIRAVESGSKHHMMKLVIYWTLFSLFSLFEFAFGKIIEWIPLWSRVRLVVILWLVMPQFDGACHAYQELVRPVLWVKVQEVTDRFYKLKEERFCERETSLDVVEKYINENGSGAVEEPIALKHEGQKCIKSQRDDMKVVESEGKNAAAASKQVSYAQSTASLNQTDAVTDVKETTPPQEIADDRLPETPPITKTQPEWTCGLCKMTAMSEIALNAHLQGKKHKSRLESLKASMLCAKDKGPSPLVEEMMPSKETAEKRCHETSPLKKAQQEWTCDLCNVTTTSKRTLNCHLRGSKHKSILETLKASKDKDASKLNHVKKSGSELEKLVESKVQIKAKETTPVPEASGKNKCAETPSLEQAQQEWTCHLCEVTGTSVENLDAHFKGSKHKSNLEYLKTNKLRANDAGLPPSAKCKGNQDNLVGTESSKDGEGSVNKSSKAETTTKHWCFVCDVKWLSDVDLASHLSGKRHSSNIEALSCCGL